MANNQGGQNTTRWRLYLNNILQRSYGRHTLQWERTFSRSRGVWTVIAYINNIEYGRGESENPEVAAEQGAEEAYYQLRDQLAAHLGGQTYLDSE